MIDLFGGWGPIVRVLVIGPLAYASMVLLLRVSGKRTLSKMNAFDFVITIALGSVLAATLTDSSLALSTGVAVMALLILSQLVITALSVRLNWVERVVKADPSLVVLHGRLLEGAMRRHRVTKAEISAAVRASGKATIDQVEAVVLETDGSFTVIGEPPVEEISETPGDGTGQA